MIEATTVSSSVAQATGIEPKWSSCSVSRSRGIGNGWVLIVEIVRDARYGSIAGSESS